MNGKLRPLSADAKYFAWSMFRMMEPGIGRLVFHMKESRPSSRSQAALDELVAFGALSVEPFNQYGGLVYRPLITFGRAKTPPGDWPITEAITDLGRAALKQGEPM